MQLEFHQLDLRWEHLRVREPRRQRQLLASLAESGQQTPIVVVVSKDNPDRYLVIDGHKRIAALEQLGRDTVEATVWPMGEAEALLLSRSLRFSPQESALEQGWLLSEMEQRFGYPLDELARRFDRSISWVSRRLALVELLPEVIQRQVREGDLTAQTASAVLCYSRLLFFQINPTFQRFDCKVFLTDAVRYMNGAPERVMIDNTHVVVLRGTGREMIPVPEMEAFAERLGFRFVAHAIGDANRSARVERPFWFIENNFLAGRTFASWQDLNQRAREWCDKVNSTYKKHIRAVPRELFVAERPHLKPLPAWIPEVYRLHQRTVDVEGYVSVNSIRYSVPVAWIGRRVEIRETKNKIDIELDARNTITHNGVTHDRALTPLSQRITLAEHRPPRGEGVKRNAPHPEERTLIGAAPEIAAYVTALKQSGRKVVALALRQLLRLLREYPREPFLAAVAEAARYGLYDLDRLERMILRRVARDYFLLTEKDGNHD